MGKNGMLVATTVTVARAAVIMGVRELAHGNQRGVEEALELVAAKLSELTEGFCLRLELDEASKTVCYCTSCTDGKVEDNGRQMSL